MAIDFMSHPGDDDGDNQDTLTQSLALTGIGALATGFLLSDESAFTAFCAANDAEGDNITVVRDGLAAAHAMFTEMREVLEDELQDEQDELMLRLLGQLSNPGWLDRVIKSL